MTVAATSGPSQGWYPDPHDSSLLRWWNGTGWTEFTASLPPAAPAAQEPNTIPPVATEGSGPAFVATTSSNGFVLEPEETVAEPVAAEPVVSPRLEPQTFAGQAHAEPITEVIEDIPAVVEPEPVAEIVEDHDPYASFFTPLPGSIMLPAEPEAVEPEAVEPMVEEPIAAQIADDDPTPEWTAFIMSHSAPEATPEPFAAAAVPVLEPEPVVEVEPIAEVEPVVDLTPILAEPVIEPEPVADVEPIFELGVIEVEPVAAIEAIVEPEPSIEVEPVIELEPAIEVEAIVEPEPVFELEPVAEVEALIEPEPVFELEPVAEVEPVIEAEPVIELEPVAEVEAIVEPEPVFELEPVAEVEALIEPEPVFELEPVIEAEPVVEPEPVIEADVPTLEFAVAPPADDDVIEVEPVAVTPVVEVIEDDEEDVEPEVDAPAVSVGPPGFAFRARAVALDTNLPVYVSPLSAMKSPLPVKAEIAEPEPQLLIEIIEPDDEPEQTDEIAAIAPEPLVEEEPLEDEAKPVKLSRKEKRAAKKATKAETAEPEMVATATAIEVDDETETEIETDSDGGRRRKNVVTGAAFVAVAAAGAAGVTNLMSDNGTTTTDRTATPAAAMAPGMAGTAELDTECLKLWNTTDSQSAASLRVTLGQFTGALAQVSRVAPLPGTLMEPNSCALTVYDPGTATSAIFVAGVKDQVGYLDVTAYPRASKYGFPKTEGQANVEIKPDGTIRAI